MVIEPGAPITRRPAPTGWAWDHEYIREHCTMDFNAIYRELWHQAGELGYNISPDDIETDAQRILDQWEYDSTPDPLPTIGNRVI